jgi:hypothetical protein
MARPLYAVPDAALHTTDARLQCAAHAIAAALPELMPSGVTPFKNGPAGQIFGLNDDDFGLPQEFHQSGGFSSFCEPTDGVCIQIVLSCNGFRPAAVGAAVAQGLLFNRADDGWNHEGQLSRDGYECTANCRPYQDSSSYDTEKLSASCVSDNTCWRELVEDNGRGFFSRQEHVCAHIGTHARPISVSRADIDARVCPGADSHPHHRVLMWPLDPSCFIPPLYSTARFACSMQLRQCRPTDVDVWETGIQNPTMTMLKRPTFSSTISQRS